MSYKKIDFKSNYFDLFEITEGIYATISKNDSGASENAGSFDLGNYLVVFDTIVEDMPDEFFADRPWGKGNNPKTAVREFLKRNKRFIVDRDMEKKLLITVAPEGYLKCIKD